MREVILRFKYSSLAIVPKKAKDMAVSCITICNMRSSLNPVEYKMDANVKDQRIRDTGSTLLPRLRSPACSRVLHLLLPRPRPFSHSQAPSSQLLPGEILQ